MRKQNATKTMDELYRWYGTKGQAIRLADKLKELCKDYSSDYMTPPGFVIAQNKNGFFVKKVQLLSSTGEIHTETITKFRGVQILATL